MFNASMSCRQNACIGCAEFSEQTTVHFPCSIDWWINAAFRSWAYSKCSFEHLKLSSDVDI